jgi:hypothetical protein
VHGADRDAVYAEDPEVLKLLLLVLGSAVWEDDLDVDAELCRLGSGTSGADVLERVDKIRNEGDPAASFLTLTTRNERERAKRDEGK